MGLGLGTLCSSPFFLIIAWVTSLFPSPLGIQAVSSSPPPLLFRLSVNPRSSWLGPHKSRLIQFLVFYFGMGSHSAA